MDPESGSLLRPISGTSPQILKVGFSKLAHLRILCGISSFFESRRISDLFFKFTAGDRGASQLQQTPPLRPPAQHVLSHPPCVFFAMGGAET